jgi:hypothetical protein
MVSVLAKGFPFRGNLYANIDKFDCRGTNFNILIYKHEGR